MAAEQNCPRQLVLDETGNEVWNMCQWSEECLNDFGGSGQNVSLQPLFDGGVWNYFWAKETYEQANVCNTPCDPTLDPNEDTKLEALWSPEHGNQRFIPGCSHPQA